MSYQKEKWNIEKHLDAKSTPDLEKSIKKFEKAIQDIGDGLLNEKALSFYSENLQIMKMKFAERIGKK